ncbi:hypothetical protein BB559_002439 [Furculomyces boomerangus]|uniref:Uncharacterized protein n=2 Tax=Harpellales TaxID=61421 RepID=A0A2T9YGR5_9FUNG|nr:hypothetical protein BB559_004101 [Furculomyces boomerangus]PVU96279.1 hypothetical protein BB559_002439 [Furculomyces boomerangus]PVZ97451.1 hypothetical protein BB558_006600 [Smittium angustum]PVZ99305.1 hypothetical protein BB558_004666 [Smittium angustum]
MFGVKTLFLAVLATSASAKNVDTFNESNISVLQTDAVNKNLANAIKVDLTTLALPVDLATSRLYIALNLTSPADIYVGFTPTINIDANMYELKFGYSGESGIARAFGGPLVATGPVLGSSPNTPVILGIEIDPFGTIKMGTGTTMTVPLSTVLSSYNDTTPLPAYKFLSIYTVGGTVTMNSQLYSAKYVTANGEIVPPKTITTTYYYTNTNTQFTTYTVSASTTLSFQETYPTTIPSTAGTDVQTSFATNLQYSSPPLETSMITQFGTVDVTSIVGGSPVTSIIQSTNTVPLTAQITQQSTRTTVINLTTTECCRFKWVKDKKC